MRRALRRVLREIGIRFPVLQRYGGRLGLGRLLSGHSGRAQVRLDGDIIIEFDLSVPFFRYLYYLHDLSRMPESYLIRCLLGPEDVFVDVGAFIGYWTLLAAKYASQVFAFEPSLATFTYLQRNLELNPTLARKVVALSSALSDHIGYESLYRPSSQPDLASLQWFPAQDIVKENVSVTTLDDILLETIVSFIKIDVEGAELKVLQGGHRVMQRSRPLVLCELFEPYQVRFGASCQQIIHFFANYDYQAYRVQLGKSRKSGVILTPLELGALNDTTVENALFVPVEKGQKIAQLRTLDDCG